MTRDHIQGIDADRAGCSQYDQSLPGMAHDIRPSQNSTTRPTRGKVDVRLSIRSSAPPCPGRIAPLSLTPAWRLARDSNKSPRMLTAVRIIKAIKNSNHVLAV